MRYCISDLIKLETDDSKTFYDKGDRDDEIEEEDHEAICSLFTTIGLTIDRPQAADFMKVCFDKIKKLSVDKKLPSRSRFMCKFSSAKCVPVCASQHVFASGFGLTLMKRRLNDNYFQTRI